MSILRDSSPDVIHHFHLLCVQHASIEVMWIGCGHENYSISIEVVFSEIGTVPHSHLSVLIEPDQCLIDGECTQAMVKFVETDECLTEHV